MGAINFGELGGRLTGPAGTGTIGHANGGGELGIGGVMEAEEAGLVGYGAHLMSAFDKAGG